MSVRSEDVFQPLALHLLADVDAAMHSHAHGDENDVCQLFGEMVIIHCCLPCLMNFTQDMMEQFLAPIRNILLFCDDPL